MPDLGKPARDVSLLQFLGTGRGHRLFKLDCRLCQASVRRLPSYPTLVYLPHLDYNLQRLGPDDSAIARDIRQIDQYHIVDIKELILQHWL